MKNKCRLDGSAGWRNYVCMYHTMRIFRCKETYSHVNVDYNTGMNLAKYPLAR